MDRANAVRAARLGGFTLVEVLASLAITGLLLAAAGGVLGRSFQAWQETRERNDLVRRARFAMERMADAVGGSRRLLLPLGENPNTPQLESVRAVLAVTLDPTLDLDRDGFADADNDRDGRIDEDYGRDSTKDNAPGIYLVDDDADGSVDDSGPSEDNDEDGTVNEDPANGLDDDGDGSIDEDSPADHNLDGKPGIASVDDDGDGLVDEGQPPDDDEDGLIDEDWLDPVVYRLQGSTLLERMPKPGNSGGRDYNERTLAENVTQFRVERLPPASADRPPVVDLTLTLTGPSGQSHTLRTRVRLGGGR